MSESEKAQSETGSSRTTTNLNESIIGKENKKLKNYSSIKKSFSRYQQENDEDLDDESKNQNLTINQSENESKPEIQMIQSSKINKISRDVSYVNSEEDYQKKIAIILSEKKPNFNDSQQSDRQKEVEENSIPSQKFISQQEQSHSQSIEIMSFQRQSKRNKKNEEQSHQASRQGESAKLSSKESILMSKNKTSVPLKKQDSFKGFQYFDNLDQYEVKLKKNIFQENSQEDDDCENYYEGKQQLKSRSPSKSAGEESDKTEDFKYEAQFRKNNLEQYLTVDKFKSQKQINQPQQYQKYQNNFERQFDKPVFTEKQNIQQKRQYNSNQPSKKLDNIKLANHNLKITQELLQKAKDKRLNALKQIDLDNEKYQNKLNDLKNKKSKKSLKNDSSLKQITERSEKTQFSDSNSRRRDMNLKAKTIKWKKGEQQTKPILKNYKKQYEKIEKEQMNYSIPKESNIKKTYRWLISQYDELEDRYNLKSHSTQNINLKDKKYSNYYNEKVQRQEVPRTQSIESKNSNQNQIRSRSASYEGTYNKTKSPDQKKQYEQKMYEYLQKQFKQNQDNQIQLTNQNKNSKVVKALDSLGLQSQFAERLYRNHKFIKAQIPEKIDFEVVQKHKSYNNKERLIVPSPNKVQFKEQEKAVPKLNQSIAIKEKRIDEILKADPQNPKSKFNIERISYDQFKSKQDNYITPSPAQPLNTQISNLNNNYDLHQSQRKPLEPISNQALSLDLMKLKYSSSVTNKEAQDVQIEKQESQLSIRNMFTSLGHQGQTNLSMSNSQTWMPQIYAELCKSRAQLAKKDIQIKQLEQDMESKNKQLQVMEDIKQNYQSLQEIFDEQKNQYDQKEKQLDQILDQKEGEYLLREQDLRQLFIQKEEEYLLKEQELRQLFIQKEEENVLKEQELRQQFIQREEDYHLKEYELRSILIQKEQVIQQFQMQKDMEIRAVFNSKDEEFDEFKIKNQEELEKFKIQKDFEQKQLQLDQIEIIEKFESLINSQNQYKNLNNTLTTQSQDFQIIYQKSEMKDQFQEIINKLQYLFTDIQNEVKKKEKENKRALSQEIKELEERVEAMNQNFEQLEQQKEDQERVIDSLKQIIMLQEKLKTSEFNQFNDGIRTQVLKGIEDIMVEEQSKQMLAKMAWVSQLSDKTLSRDNLNITQKQDLRLSVEKKLQNNQSQPSSFEDVQTNDMNNMMQSQMSIQVQNYEKQSKEVIIQTDIDLMSEFKEEVKSNNSKNTQMTKNFKVLSNDIKQNMNEILNQQLQGFLQTNVNEIASLKIEIERINEKYSQEKLKVEALKQELQKKNKYQQHYENYKNKKYRNCGVQVGQSKFKDFSAGQDNSKENFSDISNLALSQNYQNDILNKKKENTLGKIKTTQDKSLKISEKNGSQDLSSSQFSKYEYQVSSKSQNLKKNKLKTQNTRLSKSNFDEDSYNKTQSQIQIIDQKTQVNEQEILKFQIKQNQKLYMMLKTYVQSHSQNSEDTKAKELQQNIISFIESSANQMSRTNINENDKNGKNELTKIKSAIFGADQDNISKSDLMQSWDEFSQEQIGNENYNLLSAKARKSQNSIQKSMGSGINKSLNPTEKTVKQGAQTVIGQGIQNYKAISFENSQQISEAANLDNENLEMVKSFQNIKYTFANKLQGLQKEIKNQGADK